MMEGVQQSNPSFMCRKGKRDQVVHTCCSSFKGKTLRASSTIPSEFRVGGGMLSHRLTPKFCFLRPDTNSQLSSGGLIRYQPRCISSVCTYFWGHQNMKNPQLRHTHTGLPVPWETQENHSRLSCLRPGIAIS